MLVRKAPDIRSSEITDEKLYLNRFVESQPATAWSMSNPREYGFLRERQSGGDHPRWSQARERRIGEFFKRKTLPFNGYQDQVASFYACMDLRKFY